MCERWLFEDSGFASARITNRSGLTHSDSFHWFNINWYHLDKHVNHNAILNRRIANSNLLSECKLNCQPIFVPCCDGRNATIGRSRRCHACTFTHNSQDKSECLFKIGRCERQHLHNHRLIADRILIVQNRDQT